MEYIKGPDFPTGGIIMGRQGIVDAYNTGRGRVVIRAKAEIEEIENGREAIVVTEVPYMVNKADMLARISEMVRDKKIEGISDIRELTSREGIRIEFIIKKDANASVVLNTLYKYTALQSSFSINNVALVNGRPRTLTLKDMLSTFVDFRHEVVVRRTRFELDKAQKRAHILEGLLKAIDVIDEIIAIIKASSSVDAAKMTLSERFGFDDIQASAIVEMRLRQLTGLEKEKLQNEYDELEKFIARCEQILASGEEQLAIVKKESMELKAKYGDARRSEITLSDDEFNPEDFYADEDVVITISHLGYIKRTSLTEFKTQARGGVGKKAVAEHRAPQIAQTRQNRDLGGKRLVGNRGGGVAGTFQNEHAEEVRHAHAEGRQREAGHVLIGAQADGQEAVDQATEHRREERARER